MCRYYDIKHMNSSKPVDIHVNPMCLYDIWKCVTTRSDL